MGEGHRDTSEGWHSSDCFRELLEEDSTTLTSASNLRQLLPFILHEEVAKLKSEVKGRPISLMELHMCVRQWS